MWGISSQICKTLQYSHFTALYETFSPGIQCMLCGNKDLCLYRSIYMLLNIVCFALALQSYNTISQMISIRFSVINIVTKALPEKTERVSIARDLSLYRSIINKGFVKRLLWQISSNKDWLIE